MKTNDAKYEEDILTSFEKGEWQSVPNLKNEIARYAASAAATLTKDKRINIRLSSRDRLGADVLRHFGLRQGFRASLDVGRKYDRNHSRPRMVSDYRDVHPFVHRRDGQERTVSAPCLVARLDGRADPDFSADSRSNHGNSGYFHGGSHVAPVRVVADSLVICAGYRCHYHFFHGADCDDSV